MSSDEPPFSSEEKTRLQIARKASRLRYTICTMKHSPTQMIWSAILEDGVVGLYFLPFETSINGPQYVELWLDKLKMHMHIHRCTIFMQGGTFATDQSCDELSLKKQDQDPGMAGQ